MIDRSETVSISQIKMFKYVVLLLNQNYFRDIILNFLHPILLSSVTFSAPLGLSDTLKSSQNVKLFLGC
jgi:hypothetical protein